MHDHQRFLNCLMDFTSIPAAVICHGFHYISKLMYETLHFRRLKCSWFLVTNMKPRMSFDRTTWAGWEHRPLPRPVGHSYIISWIYPDILMPGYISKIVRNIRLCPSGPTGKCSPPCFGKWSTMELLCCKWDEKNMKYLSINPLNSVDAICPIRLLRSHNEPEPQIHTWTLDCLVTVVTAVSPSCIMCPVNMRLQQRWYIHMLFIQYQCMVMSRSNI